MVEEFANPKLKMLTPVVKGLAKILGKDYEVNLHDLSKPENSLVLCENGHVTGRKPGGPMTDFGLYMMQDEDYKKKEGNFNYLARNNRGELIRCSAIFIRDDEDPEKVIGFLCVNYDLKKAMAAQELLGELLHFNEEPVKEYHRSEIPSLKAGGERFPIPVKEWFAQDLEEVVTDSLSQIKMRIAKPLSYLSKKEKQDVISELHDKGFFLLKGAVDILAAEMENTKYTIYSYIRDVQKKEKEPAKKKKQKRLKS
ncbi:helix-turn-helix transcriptional regulator [Synergistaceae bacterium OttesenSCG-928-D05]|nr:helix-turn-helix transcriptional regulator [Synergistaceae bacterium OttesenSCG-928-D05]